MTDSLFPADAASPHPPSASSPPLATAAHGTPRLRRAERTQAAMVCESLDDRLPAEHTARLLWDFVTDLDLTLLHQKIAAVEGHCGRDATDPRILVTLWLYATTDGVGSARELADLCGNHRAYEWIRGDVSLNHHTLSDFRTAHGDFVDHLLTHSVAALLHQGLIGLQRVAQDGMRVRASAGSSALHRRPSLTKCLAEAEAHVTALRAELAADPGARSRRQQAAQERAARERQERLTQALAELQTLEQRKEARAKGTKDQARASTTDPQARKMKMADGGYRPAYNVQFATTTVGQAIVGVDVIASGNDGGQLAPMVAQLERRYGRAPEEYLADGGFSTLADIEAVSTPARGTRVYTPVKDMAKKRAAGADPFAPRPGDSAAVAAWRARMGTPEAQAIYKERAGTAECVNAQARNRGLWQFRVRGQAKVLVVALWYAITHNVLRLFALRTARQPA